MVDRSQTDANINNINTIAKKGTLCKILLLRS